VGSDLSKNWISKATNPSFQTLSNWYFSLMLDSIEAQVRFVLKNLFTSVCLLIATFCFSNEGYFYHGSLTDEIERLEPRLRYTPGNESNSPAGIYASDLPAFAAAHSFPWSSDEGIDLYVVGETVMLEIPRSLVERLQIPVHVYRVENKLFSQITCDLTGHTFRATEPVDCLEKKSFSSVVEAIEYYGGYVVIQED